MPSLGPSEYRRRISALRTRLTESDADAFVSFVNHHINYLVGFPHVQTERPVVLLVTDSQTRLIVPQLERRRAQRVPAVDAVETYFDHPTADPVADLGQSLSSKGIRSVVADADGAPSVMGYDGPTLSTFVEVDVRPWIREMRREKSPAELSLIRDSASIADRTHGILESNLAPGVNPLLASESTMTAATERLLEDAGAAYEPRTRFRSPILAGIVSGEQTALPHAYTANEPLSSGDVVISGVVVDVGGYLSELERTMVVGDADGDRLTYLDIVAEAQSLAIDAIEPGVPAGHVEQVTRDYFEEQGVLDLVEHHAGHAIGLEPHESPYLDRGSDATLSPGEVYAVEPALYTEGEGYRHSDTVVVTEDGCEVLTTTPKDRDAVTLSGD